jgi:hypothetical protein
MADMGNLTWIAGSDLAGPADLKARVSRGTMKLGRAYRADRLVCACVHVTIGRDDRLGLAPRERRIIQVRFHEPLDDGLRTELSQLVRRRGAAACRVAERVHPIELVIDDRHGEHVRIIGRLEPPQVRHGQIGDINFGLCVPATR